MWSSEDFRALSAPKPNAQTMWFRLLTGPERGNLPGLFPWTVGGFADRMGWPTKDVRRCLAEIEARGMAVYDASAGLMWLPSAFEHNPPTSINQVKAWAKASRALPPCELKARAMASLMASLMAKGKPWAEAFGMPRAMQEQEQYQKQEQQQHQELESRGSHATESPPDSPRAPDLERPGWAKVLIAIREIHGQDRFDPTSYRRDLEWIAAKPEAEIRRALEHYAADPWVKANPGHAHPSHIRKHWDRYLDGPPKNGDPLKGPIAAKSAAEYDHAGGTAPWDL